MADEELTRLRAEIDRLTRAVEEARVETAEALTRQRRVLDAQFQDVLDARDLARRVAQEIAAERDRYRDEAESADEAHRTVVSLNAHLHRELDALREEMHGMQNEALTLAAALERMRAALEFYADPASWRLKVLRPASAVLPARTMSLIHSDNGERARDALTLAANQGRMRTALDEWRAKAIATNEQLAFAELAATNLEDAARAVLSAAKALQGKRLALDDDDGDEVYIQGPHDDVCWGVTEELNALDAACVALCAALTPTPQPLADAITKR